MKNKFLKILLSLPFLIVAGLFAFYLLFSYFAVNPLAQRILPWVAETRLASKATVDRVSFDPFGLTITIDNLRLTQPDGGELAGFDRLYLNLETSGIFRFALRLKDIHLSGPKALVEVLPDGSLNWSALIAKLNEDKKEDDSNGMPRLLIDHILIEQGDVRYIDHTRETPLRIALQPLGIELDALSTLPEDRGDYSIVANLPEQGGALKWKGVVGLNPIVSSGELQLEGFKVVKLLQFARQALPVQVTGGRLSGGFSYDFSMLEDKPQAVLKSLTLSLDGLAGKLPQSPASFSLNDIDIKIPALNFAMEQTPQVQFANMDVRLRKAGLVYDKQTLLNIPALDIRQVGFDLAARKLNVGELVLDDVAIQAVRDKSGNTDWQRLMAALPKNAAGEQASAVPEASVQDAAAPAGAGEGKTRPEQPAWDVHLQRFALQSLGVHMEDQVPQTPVVLDIQKGLIEVADVSLDMGKALPVNLALNVRQGGHLEVSGTVQPTPLSGDLDVRLSGFALKPFAPYINQVALLNLKSGDVDVVGKVKLTTGKALSTQFNGGFKVNQLAITEEHGEAPFLGWYRLAGDQVALGLEPNRLHISELRVTQPFGKFIIYEDRTLNVTRILRKPEPQSASQAPPPTAEKTQAPFPVAVDRVRIENANMEFADLSLLPQFGTRMRSLSGVINGLSTNPKTTAQVELDGMVDEYGSARIRGSLQPFQATDFTDIKLVFRNLDMTRLTPYSGKFAGRRIDAGKLSVDLEYKIKHRQLAGENQMVINKLKLGERVDSPDAMHLPLDLAIALLEDSDGVIDLNLPVSGNLDDPQFSYGKIVWKAIVNVLTKVVTSPFRALGNLLGIESDKLEGVMFDAGQSHLLPPEQEKLNAIAEAMAKRPALTLSIEPAYDAVADVRAIQEQTIRYEIAKKLRLKVDNGEQAGPLDLTNSKTQRAVEELYAERVQGANQKKLVERLTDVFTKPKQPEPSPEERVQQLKASVQVTEPELVALAQARADRVRQYLVEAAGLPDARVSVVAGSKQSSAKDGVAVKLSLGAEPAH